MDLGLTRSAVEEEGEGDAFRPLRTDQRAVEVTVCDLSTSGFMAECLRPVLIGSFVSLDLPGIGPVNAQVRWQVGGRLGGKFLDSISLRRCDWTATQD
jgi:hypothetical protein